MSRNPQLIPLDFALSTQVPGGSAEFYSERLINMMAQRAGRSGHRAYSQGRRAWEASTVPGVKPPSVSGWRGFHGVPLAAFAFRPRQSSQEQQSLLVATTERLYYCPEGNPPEDLGRFLIDGPDGAEGRAVEVSDLQIASDGFSVILVDRPSGQAWELQHPVVESGASRSLGEWRMRYINNDLAEGLPGNFGGVAVNSGRYLVPVKGTDKMRYSYAFGAFDPSRGGDRDDIFPPSAELTAESDSDLLLSIEVNQRAVYLFGEKTVELFYPDPESIYTQATGGAMRWGVASAQATTSLGLSVYWLDDACQLWMAETFKPKLVSELSQSQAIRKALGGDLRKARLTSHAWNGHKLICIHTHSEEEAGPTFIFDAETGFWHERVGTEGTDPATPAKAWPVKQVISCYGRSWAVMDEGVGEYADEVYAYGTGAPFLRRMQTSRLAAFPNLVSISNIELLATFSAEDPLLNEDPLRVHLYIHNTNEPPAHAETIEVGGLPQGDSARARRNRLLFTNVRITGTYVAFDFRLADGKRPWEIHECYALAQPGNEDGSGNSMVQGGAPVPPGASRRDL